MDVRATIEARRDRLIRDRKTEMERHAKAMFVLTAHIEECSQAIATGDPIRALGVLVDSGYFDRTEWQPHPETLRKLGVMHLVEKAR